MRMLRHLLLAVLLLSLAGCGFQLATVLAICSRMAGSIWFFSVSVRLMASL